MLIEVEEVIMDVEVAEEISQDRDLEVQVPIEVESSREEVALMVDKDEEITAQTQVLEQLASPPKHVQEVGGSYDPTSINNFLRASIF